MRSAKQTRTMGKCSALAFLFILISIIFLGFVLSGTTAAVAAPDGCVEEPSGSGIFICRGNQSQGISISSSAVTELNVKELSPIEITPGSGIGGIDFKSTSAGNVILKSGELGSNIAIQTQDASGIVLQSSGTAPAPQTDTVLGIPIPGKDSISGGVVQLESHSNITTTGDGAHGIETKSSTTGYPQAVIDSLENFEETNVSFEVVSVDSSADNVSQQVQAVLIDASGEPVEGDGGTFTINDNGTYDFDAGTAFDDLAEGESRTSIIGYEVLLTTANGSLTSEGHLVVTATMSAEGDVTYIKNAYFPDFGVSWKADPEDTDVEANVFPDLTGYVDGLIADAAAGGAGNSVSINSAGIISTQGNDSHGILAQSEGASGGTGRTGNIWHSAGRGGLGRRGGSVSVTANGTITTNGDRASGVVAVSRAGNGGTGGDGGGGGVRWGATGGTGGDGGEVYVHGSGVITTGMAAVEGDDGEILVPNGSGDYSSGIIALSEGGNGGDGGEGHGAMGAGNGGTGGKGGPVEVIGDWDIVTGGDKAHGIWAKSMGGNAGDGGSAGWLRGGGGSGGQATDGGSVTVESRGEIETWGTDSYGIFAQSVGGFGGKGGSGFGLFYAAGGDGNSAGSGGSVTITNSADGYITTRRARSHAVFAQSIGGGGGSGGGVEGLVGVGGEGAAGGHGGAIDVTNHGQIWTFGENARGIYAQSIGGGGGDGGNSGGLVPIGGKGSGTSNGGEVTVTNTGHIETHGEKSNAIFAESIGGGGGDGGSASGWFSVGGGGGGGGDADNVTVANSGFLHTRRADSSAIFAQSVGGGGGNGGDSVSAGVVGSLAIGGKGAAGGDAGERVEVIHEGTIVTGGARSHGIHAQSVGGGGGNGGYAVSAAVGAGISLSAAIGGQGGGGGDGQTVAIQSSGSMLTQGKDAHGIFAQSVGGGGGSGGFSIAGAASQGLTGSLSMGGSGAGGGHGGDVFLGYDPDSEAVDWLTGDIFTIGEHAYGILAQSVGGGGGDGGFSIAGSISTGGPSAALALGGSGAGGGTGGDVSIYSQNNVTTSGRDSHGIVAQSVGGGGGSGGFSIAGAAGSAGLAGSLGGSGGGGNTGGKVTLESGGRIATMGEHAYGLLAQSVGGGGGDGGFSVGASGGLVSGAFSMGGSGGDGGGATGGSGAVTVKSDSFITTEGKDSHGIVAQSVGGGGGSGGFSVAGSVSKDGGAAASIGGVGGEGGNGGNVSVTSTGDIQTGIADRGQAGIEALEGIGDGSIDALRQAGFSLIAELKGTSVEGLTALDGIDDAEAEAILDAAWRHMTKGDHAYGILAQSVGGGGGDGGFSVAGSISKSASASFSMGGSGGGGGAGGLVTAESSGNITTRGDDAHAIVAQSIGGGGGSGGFSVAGGVSGTGGQVGASIGGAGGSGGESAQVTVTILEGTIATAGDRSYGILAQSVGGGGGSGGFSIAGGLGKSASANFSLGGGGGDGGTGGEVTVDNAGTILTAGELSHGIVAQSVGGGGGSGGFSAVGSLGSGDNAKQFAASIGGSGGDGGHSDVVWVDNSGAIVVQGDRAKGVLAQSIGGGGGDGGMSLSGSFGGTGAKNFSGAVGGSGGTGGFGGEVHVTNSGTIDTLGAFSHGIQAQSIGGGGGNGGLSVSAGFGIAGKKESNTNLNLSVGGSGGDGNHGGTVTVANQAQAAIVTRGDDAHGIYAQSIGGGGGDGGASLSLTIGIDPGGEDQEGKTNNLNIAVGGAGGDGSAAGQVTITNGGEIQTFGDESHGIYAQSIGGGGGNGGSARAISLILGKTDDEEEAENEDQDDSQDEDQKKEKENKSLQVAVGGEGGSGGTGGDVNVTNTGRIVTRGADAHAIFVQSIGGGGGTGGNGAHGVPEDLPLPDIINDELQQQLEDRDKKSDKAWENLTITVGGKGGIGNDAGAVTIDHTGDVVTMNNGSYGVLAQSIGAGGGVGGNGAVGEGGNLGIGGSGGASGNGGTVTLNIHGNIDTVGVSAHGIFAQSVGGGGGIAGNLDFGVVDGKADNSGPQPNVPSFNVGIGGDGGSGGNGGPVLVNSTGDITTRGRGANGIFAQSVGGGGGVGGSTDLGLDQGIGVIDSFLDSVEALIGSAGGDGAGGNVTVDHTGDIVTLGDVAHGIFAQSAGGRQDDLETSVIRQDEDGNFVDEEGNIVSKNEDGDIIDQDGNIIPGRNGELYTEPMVLEDLSDHGGDINIRVSGNVLAYGANSHGIFAQSLGDDGRGDMTIDIAGGVVQGGSDSGVGVRLKNGAANQVNIGADSTVMSLAGVSGSAIFAGDGDETVNNAGVVIGSVDLGSGVNTFINERGAVFEAGEVANLGGEENVLSNSGTISPGGAERVSTTTLSGSLEQTGTGVLAADLDTGAGRADRLDVSGTAVVGGRIAAGLANAGYAKPGAHQFTVLRSDGGVTNRGLDLTYQPSGVVDYQLYFPDSNTVAVRAGINFAPLGLNGNQVAIGNAINAIQRQGGSESMAPVVAELYALPELGYLASAYDQLSPESHDQMTTVTFDVARQHTGTINNRMSSLRSMVSPLTASREKPFNEEPVLLAYNGSDASLGQYLVREKQEAGQRRFGAWASGYGQWGDQDDEDDFRGYDYDIFGVTLGFDYSPADGWITGLGVGRSSTNVNFDDNAGNGDIDSYFGSLYAGYSEKKFYVESILTYGRQDYDTKRNLVIGNLVDTARSSHDGDLYSAYLGGGYFFEQDNMRFGPFATLQYIYLDEDGFDESGAGGANLIVDGRDTNGLISQLGIRAGSIFDTGIGRLVPEVSLAWLYDFDIDDRVVTSAFAGSPGASFSIDGQDVEKNGVVVGAGLSLLQENGFVTALGYSGEFRDGYSAHAVIGQIRFEF